MSLKTSPSKKLYYASGPSRVAANKKRRMAKHLKKHPSDQQTKATLAA